MTSRSVKGTELYLLAGYIASRPEHFAEPQSFNPERWLVTPPHAREGHNTHAFVPFGAGPRFCPGRRLAMLEIKMLLAMLCRNFDVARFPSSTTAGRSLLLHDDASDFFVRLRSRQRVARSTSRSRAIVGLEASLAVPSAVGSSMRVGSQQS